MYCHPLRMAHHEGWFECNELRALERLELAMLEPAPALDSRYRIGPMLGQGGFGRVYAARDRLLERDVAIKIARENQFSRFSREARAAAALQSPHAVRIFDFGCLETGAPYLVLERLNGCSLKEHLRETGPIQASQVVEWLMQVCHALEEAHGLGLVHRDVKPSNLFLHRSAGGQTCIKLLDFGLVKSSTEKGETTESGITVGSPAYMAPEQLRGAELDPRSDVWALGVVLFELVTGQRPFDGPTNEAILSAVAADPPRFDAWMPQAPSALLGIVERCLRKDLGARIQSVGALRGELARIDAGRAPMNSSDANETIEVAVNAFSSHPIKTPRPSAGRYTWGALALALGVALFATFRATQASPSRSDAKVEPPIALRSSLQPSAAPTHVHVAEPAPPGVSSVNSSSETPLPPPTPSRHAEPPALPPEAAARLSGPTRPAGRVDLPRRGAKPTAPSTSSAPAFVSLSGDSAPSNTPPSDIFAEPTF